MAATEKNGQNEDVNIFFAVQSKDGLDAKIDDRFGRAPFFMVYNLNSEQIVWAGENPYLDLGHGVGVKAANLVLEHRCRYVVGPQFGPKADEVLKAGQVTRFNIKDMTVSRALDIIKSRL